METGPIEREIYIEASPEVVFDVVSDPKHVSRWWPDEARYELEPGAPGEIVFGDPQADGKVVAFTVVEARPPRTFSFRWTQPAGHPATAGNSLLVTFDLVPSGQGTLLTFSERGFREEEVRADHVNGWDYFLPRLAPYLATLDVRP
ncbi:SRPBCC family protein [Actinoplanes sp. M2I2]|uniref:SRPBCC family protein n=1 Tax=Actinoplanes sp. M2I2 TaxID=1734444 RepID=UPI002021DBEE|nr:SRPBCC family protein [Actinoplanes sp. M2I2]